MIGRVILALLLASCSSAATPSEPRPAPQPSDRGGTEPGGDAVPLDAVALPDAPPLPDDAAACARDYEMIANTPLPQRAPTQSFDAWYAGPFQGWVDHYNDVRERCDAVFAALPAEGPEAQALLGVQSLMHERLGQEAVPYEEQAQMFVMARYWTLGAACTYQHCGGGPLEAWSAFCRDRGALLPACPSVEPSAAVSE